MLTLNFDKARQIFGGSLTQPQVDGLNAVVDAWNRYIAHDNRQMLAYALATAKWESAHTMQPVKETGTAKVPQPSDDMVIARLDKAFAAKKLPWVKKPYWRDGWFGRGLVQLTHEVNYSGALRTAVLREFDKDIHADRDAVLSLPIAAFILVWGMETGVFTGKSFGAYIDAVDESDAEDYKEFMAARRIINGTDHAADIAQLALAFEAAIEIVKVPAPAPAPKRTLLDGLFRRKTMTDKAPGDTVVTEVQSAWASKVNWTMALGLIFTVLTWFGIPVTDELKLQIIALGNSAFYVIGWIMRTFFSTKVVASSAKKM